jgi:hypothetical protein
VSGSLDVPNCWSGPFDLHPDFFAAVPAIGPSAVQTQNDALEIRIQNGGDLEAFSDGLLILVDDAGLVRGEPDANGMPRPSLLGKSLSVSLPAGVTPPGVPIQAVANPAVVHASLYLERTCRTQNSALYAMDQVTLNPDGTCDRPEGGEIPLSCGGTSATSGPVRPIGRSTITFQNLFDGNPDESNAGQRYTNVTAMELYLADPREICPGGLGPPPPCRGHLTGWFHFYFQRGKPAQPFP